MITKSEIEQFLKELKEKIDVFDVVFRPRDKNLQALADLDITPIKRFEYLKKIKPEDYHAGPKKDTYDTSLPDYYEFGITINGTEVYIKISKGRTGKPVDCMSFHLAENPMNYPLKNA